MKEGNIEFVRDQLRLGLNPDVAHSQWSHFLDVDGKKVRNCNCVQIFRPLLEPRAAEGNLR